MLFDIAAMAARPRYNLLASLIVPRPIAWVTSSDASGRLNAAPFSLFNLMAGTPPVVVLGIGNRAGRPKDSARNIVETGDFVINLVSEELLGAMNVTAIEFTEDVDELAEAGLATLPSHAVGPPRIARSPVALECTYTRSVELGQGRNLIIGEIIYAHVEDGVVLNPDRGHIDAARMNLVGRMHGGGWYTTTTAPFRLPRIPVEDRPRTPSPSGDQVSGSLR
ncbi:flavin reductase family protein [Streptomyces sp. ML-6]|uniref:flavin reductase family protein n=1 Tax=Streptomyces sp. ML-6 TaxID=2982693 RepID=UPI0024BF8375|nr:flavin reductase family protein [Streptomyces sp. ML-6]MDK0524317.1 flavin reductase family protein [Streptomyces sp. ML-6]